MPEVKVQHWSAGWNPEGCLPDPDEVMHGGSIEDARDYLIADLDYELDAGEDLHPSVRGPFAWVRAELYDLDLGKLQADAEHVRAGRGNWEAGACGWVYWIMPCHTPGCGQVEDAV